MRTFSRFVTCAGSSTPILSIILADTEQRARELARRELIDARCPVSVEFREGAKLIWVEQVAGGEDGVAS